MISHYNLSARKPFDISVFIGLVAIFVIPIIAVGGITFLSYRTNASAGFERSNQNVLIPDDSLLYQTYQDNVELTSFVVDTQNKTKDEQTTVPVTTTGSVAQPGQSQLLAVPYIKQVYSLSCEVASIEMILKYFGSTTETQDSLMVRLGYAQPIVSSTVNGVMTWGNPDEGFVGKVDGRMIDPKIGIRGATGWGTHPLPVQKLLRTFYPNSYAGKGSIDGLRTNLDNNKPVMIWHVRDDASGEKVTYYTPKGKAVELKQYHVALVVGYQVQANNQLLFTINDPYYGVYTVNQQDLTRMWSKHNYDMVVAVK